VRSLLTQNVALSKRYRDRMRNILYTLGILVALLGIALTFDALGSRDPMVGLLAIQRMLVVVCGVLMFVGGAIVGAVDGLRAPQWQQPMQGGPQMGPR
jgi:hypothetical protein